MNCLVIDLNQLQLIAAASIRTRNAIETSNAVNWIDLSRIVVKWNEMKFNVLEKTSFVWFFAVAPFLFFFFLSSFCGTFFICLHLTAIGASAVSMTLNTSKSTPKSTARSRLTLKSMALDYQLQSPNLRGDFKVNLQINCIAQWTICHQEMNWDWKKARESTSKSAPTENQLERQVSTRLNTDTIVR